MSDFSVYIGDLRFEVFSFCKAGEGCELSFLFYKEGSLPLGHIELSIPHDDSWFNPTDIGDEEGWITDDIKVELMHWCNAHWMDFNEKVIPKIGAAAGLVVQSKGKWKL